MRLLKCFKLLPKRNDGILTDRLWLETPMGICLFFPDYKLEFYIRRIISSDLAFIKDSFRAGVRGKIKKYEASK